MDIHKITFEVAGNIHGHSVLQTHLLIVLTFFLSSSDYSFFSNKRTTNIKLTYKIKRHTVIVALKAVHSGLEIGHFLKITLSFVVKAHKVLKASDEDSTAISQM